MNSFTQDSSGNNSSVRLVYIVALLVIIAVWAYVSIFGMKLADMPGTVVEFVAILAGGKLLQHVSENNTFSGPKGGDRADPK